MLSIISHWPDFACCAQKYIWISEESYCIVIAVYTAVDNVMLVLVRVCSDGCVLGSCSSTHSLVLSYTTVPLWPCRRCGTRYVILHGSL